MTTSTTYKATATREGRWWIITVPELDAVTQARNVAEIDVMARGLIAALLDVEEDSVAVNVELRLPAALQNELDEARRLRAQAEVVTAQAAERSRGLVHALIEGEHMSQRDAAAVLGLSPQRVQQLTKA